MFISPIRMNGPKTHLLKGPWRKTMWHWYRKWTISETSYFLLTVSAETLKNSDLSLLLKDQTSLTNNPTFSANQWWQHAFSTAGAICEYTTSQEGVVRGTSGLWWDAQHSYLFQQTEQAVLLVVRHNMEFLCELQQNQTQLRCQWGR